MKVDFDDTPNNWTQWSALIIRWINDSNSRPNDTDAMIGQMRNAGITNVTNPVLGHSRQVHFTQADNGALQFLLPSPQMVQDYLSKLAGKQQYPLKMFYGDAFVDKTKATLSQQQMLEFASKRLGEYTIQECQ